MSSPGNVGSGALELRSITKRFDAVTALDSVDFTLRAGTVHALLGENGAGKTTLMRIAFGGLRADSGAVRVSGQTVERFGVQQSMNAGIGMVHQHLSLVPTFTALENVALGGRERYARHDVLRALQAAQAASGLAVDPAALAQDLSVVEQQRLEILKALVRGARILILDEPTAVLAPPEVDDLLQWVRRFAQTGGSVVIVTHKLREALAVADDVTVLRRGRVALSEAQSTTSENRLASAMLPDATSAEPVVPPKPAGEVVVEAHAVDVGDARTALRVRAASFQLRRHEIVGIAAVEGSGHRELLLALSGLGQVSAGSLHLPTTIRVIPADRIRDALIVDFTLTENVALRDIGGMRGWLSWRGIRLRTQRMLERFAIVAASPSALAASLSGGNQQRLVVARELEGSLDLVVADNPTRGLDIRATAFVHEQLRVAAANGSAVIVHSSDLEEVLLLATRVLVVHHGQVREVERDIHSVGRAMLGAA